MPRTVRLLITATLIGMISLATGCSSSSSSAAFCDKAKSADVANVSPTDGKKFVKVLDDLESSAPAEIKGDMKTLSEALKAVYADPTKAASIDEAKVKKASDHIEAYLKNTCHIDVSG